MKLNVNLPQDHTTLDTGAVRAFALAVEDLGIDQLTMADHVLGADVSARPDRVVRYSLDDPYREPFILMGFLAAATTRLRLGTSIVILPQRQAVLVAKQMAELDVLSGGRVTLGAGIGWNEVEFVALNQSFRNRAQRIEEQITVMRELWTRRSITFHGQWHSIDAAGLTVMPIQRPIPLWMGGTAEPALRRIARLGDGWLASTATPEQFVERRNRFHEYVREAGRDPTDVPVVPRIQVVGTERDQWPAMAAAWHATGATHVSLSTSNNEARTVDEHIDLLRGFVEALRE